MYTPRWKQIAIAIQTEIRQGRLQTGDQLPSETDLAAQYNVSRVTAHRAMHELHQLGVVVRKRRAGTVVAGTMRRTGHVAVFLNTRDTLEQQYLAGIRLGLPDEYDLLICDIRNDPEREAYYLKRMRERTDGILCLPTCDPRNTEMMRHSLRTGTRIICVDTLPEGLEVDAIISDNYGICLEALRFLTALGHRRIAHFTTSFDTLSSVRERAAAYRQALREVGVEDTTPWLHAFPFARSETDTPQVKQMAQDALLALCHSPEPPTAVFCVHDYMLSVVIQACHDLKLSIPNDLEVLSFNDCPSVVPTLPVPIHRIVQRAQEMGLLAADRLCRQLRGEAMPPEVIRIAPVFHPADAPATRTGPD